MAEDFKFIFNIKIEGTGLHNLTKVEERMVEFSYQLAYYRLITNCKLELEENIPKDITDGFADRMKELLNDRITPPSGRSTEQT